MYADFASRDNSFLEQYFNFIYRLYLAEKLSYLSYESYSASITYEFVNLGILYSTFRKELKDLDFTNLLVEAQKTETFSKIEYLPGLNYDYDVFIHDHVPFYIALTFFLFKGNLNAQKYVFDIAIKTIRKLKSTEDYTFEHHISWGLLMSASSLEFSEIFEELRDLANSRNGLLNTILFCPSFINDYQEIPDSKLILVPERNEYLEVFKNEFKHLNKDKEIHEIAIMSLSEDWKDESDYYINLGVDLSNLIIKSIP